MANAGAPQQVRVRLLKGFDLTASGQSVVLPTGAERLLACLALSERPLRRANAAAMLWSDVDADRANGNLRTTIWRVRRPGLDLLETQGCLLQLADAVRVDVRELTAQAERLLGSGCCQESDYEAAPLAGDLLPTWDDDWVVVERERIRQLRLHALERLCERLAAEGRFAQAIAAGMAAVQAEPLRESAHRAVISAHLAEGNWGEAIAEYRRFRQLLWDDLGLQPSEHMRRLVERLTDP